MATFGKWGVGGGYIGADIASALNTSETLSKALGNLDTTRLMKDAVASMQIGKAFDPMDTKSIAATLKTSDILADSLKGFDSNRLMKDALASMQIGKALDPVDIKGMVPALKSNQILADALGNLDTTRLMKDAVASMQIGKAFNPMRVKSAAELFGTKLAGLGALEGQADFESVFETDSEGDPEASFVRALIGGWFLQLPWGVRAGLVLAALDLLLVSGEWLEAADVVEAPEPATLVIGTAIALVAFVLAAGSAKGSSS
ncbi:MAG TPA: hypothetical protein VNM38_00560 [Solirubrobacterales bacterium]|nr:hypothetical protein [Solirubrobacterales bacterium]